MTLNSMNYIKNSVKLESIENTVKCSITDNPLTLDIIQEAIHSQELRRQWIIKGEEDAELFLSERLVGNVL